MRAMFLMYLSILFQIMSESGERPSGKRKRESDPDDPWASLSRGDLIQRCEQLDKHVKQLRNTLAKMTAKEAHEKRERSIEQVDRSTSVNIRSGTFSSNSSISAGTTM